ncbi:hypothetical protein M422DRAFT_268474 [Sphaerobolus stellatus SS14]|uniref:Uncharacterized protein n=1 Tax=Sphaerobolus stellatus (strain SS14) TaxID=990650 RepID=A0A0C9UMG7_SPHS4|nr:hypothetical protein M422DRAFT_268474 [Sphaerobolus stellatus SS14]
MRFQLYTLCHIELDLSEETAEGVAGPVAEAVKRWTDEAIRLEWLYVKASCERWDEEIKLLKEEGQRVSKSFEWLKKEWQNRQREWGREADLGVVTTHTGKRSGEYSQMFHKVHYR